MVGKVASLTQSGTRDWLVQRVTALILAIYTFFVVGYLITHCPLNYADWHQLFQTPWMRVFTLFALLSIFYHTWVGLWTVLTDYVKCACLRFSCLVIIILALLSYLAWGISIVWGL